MNKHLPQNGDAEDTALLFLHIPKAGGTTLHTIVERQFDPGVTFHLGSFGVDPPQSIKEFISLPEEAREKIRLVKGHMPYGLHEYLSVPATYITMLRDPVDRVISHYYFIRRTQRHYLHHEVTSKQMTLADFVRKRISTEALNDQTRLISGVRKVNTRLFDGAEKQTLEANEEPVTAEILEIAKRNLANHFTIAGLSERFDETLLLCKRLLGWGSIYYVKQNVTKGRPPKEEVDAETVRLIERHNELDRELYEHVRRGFEQMVKEQGASFGRELRTFERRNRWYARAWRGYLLTRSTFPKVRAKVGNLANNQR